MPDFADAPPTVCGFSFGRNLTKLNYPVEAAVGSVLPVCQRFVFAVGKSDDDTRQRVAAIDTSAMNGGKGGEIEIIDTTWPDVQVDGEVLSIEANKAMQAAEATGCTWGFYIQADEVIHEDDLGYTHSAMRQWADHPEVKALMFRYLHFVLDYETTDPWMYHKASRIVRLDGTCKIFGDACGPGFIDPTPEILKKNDGYLDKRHLGTHVQWARDGRLPGIREARVFHYGWVKTREQLDDKFEMVDKLWWGTLSEEEKQRRKSNKFGAFIDRYPILKKFHGSHPALMRERIAAHRPYAKVRNRLLNPRFWAEGFKHGFHG
ncbi:MAG: hypothetical protein AAGE65_06720 [Planctomycetota bacterium]